jgi:dTDP-4-amino-4,6-dideoxygalactose transaminase
VATRLASEICSLPIFPSMTEEQIDHVAAAVTEFSRVSATSDPQEAAY